MRELEEVNCEIRNVVEIQHSVTNHLNSLERDEGGPFNSPLSNNGLEGVCGGFLNDVTYAWISYGCHLIILNTKTGENCSSWAFRGKIACVCQFPAQCGELPLLLVGLDNEATRTKDSMGLLCIFDCTTSRVLRAIRMPAGVEQVCIVSGGAEWEEFNDKRPDAILTQMDGIACVVLRNLHHLLIDLKRSSWEVSDCILMDESSPAEIEFTTTKDSFYRNQSNKSKHMACNLLNHRIEKYINFNREEFESNIILNEKLTTSIISSMKIGCLISGCLGRAILWQNDGSVGWISSPVDDTMVISHLGLLEPTDDPRPFYYLWIVFQDDSFKVPPLLRMYALLFERKYSDKGTNLYFNLEAEPSLKFEIRLDTADRVVSLSTIERETNPEQTESEFRKGEDSLLLISTTSRILLFDLNQWYKEQMPHTINECKNPNSILTSYRPYIVPNNKMISCIYVPRSLQEFPNNNLSPSEELFYPSSLSLEWVELSHTKLTFWLTRGVQAELLREIAVTGPIILTQPSEIFHKCLSVGLVPFNTEVSFSSDQNAQKDMLLSLCLEQRWAPFLIRCAKEWSDGSAAYMYPSFLKWGIQRASSIKMIADRLCIPLFDQSGNNIGESEVKTLRFCCQQLECLSNVVLKLPFETSSLIKQRKALKRVSIYFQVLLWFYDVSLLPESQNLEEGSLPISLTLKIPYPFEKLHNLYKERREAIKQNNENEQVLFIDELIARECPALNLQWERESGETNTNGYYPPPSLQSLLRSYLTDCDESALNEIESKHQITIYLLMDLVMLLQGSYPGVDQLIKYPSSFKMSPSLIKLTQAFWLLDHEDYHGFLDMMTGQLVCDSDVKDWHHKLVLRTLIRNNQHKLALMYLRIKKPPLSSIQEQSTLIGLSVEHGLVQSAFHDRPQSHYAQLLINFFQACKTYDKLSDILHLALDPEEEEMFIKFLEDSKSEDIRLLYYLQRCRYMEANSIGCFNATKSLHTDMLNAYNATLPDVVKRFSANMAKASLDSDLEMRYPKPMSQLKNSQKITNMYETVIKKAKETYPRGEKSLIPFITAPCTSLKLNDDHININCVVTPKFVQKSRKRTIDQVIEEEQEDSGMRTPDKTKRRKMLDDGEAALNAALSTPLVKRKVCSSRDTPIETPHSILKIRQLIRNSTSPALGNAQEDVTDSTTSEKRRKINRQIRFSISQAENNNFNDETNGEDDNSKINVTNESEEIFVSPAASEEKSFTCKNIFTARPRPSLRRTYQQTSRESVNESLSKCPSARNSQSSAGSPNLLENCSRLVPNTPRRCTSLLATSIYSPAILSPDSSFETTASLRKSDVRPLSTFSKSADNYNRLDSSTALRNSSKSDEHKNTSIEEEEEEEEEECLEKLRASESPQKPSFQFLNVNTSREDVQNKYRNGDLSKGNVLEVDNDDEEVPNRVENNSVRSEIKERYSWSVSKRQNETRQEYDNLKNGEHIDITDDESSDSDNEVFVEAKSREEETSQMEVNNMYDASNITEDESDSNMEVDEPKENRVTPSSNEEKVKIIETIKIVEEKQTIRVVNNNSGYRESVSDSPQPKEMNLDTESPTPRVTRSRRGSSSLPGIAKETEVLLSSPAKARTPRARRASSLAKEVLIASVAAADEIKQVSSPGSEESPGISSPRKTRGRRAASVTKDVEEVRTPERRMTRRAASIQKESSEKPPSKSEATVENERTESRRTRGKQAEKKENVSSKSVKEHETTEETNNARVTRKRSNSVPKEVSVARTRRSSSLAKEVIPEDPEPALTTRSRTLSIQSVPEELEEVLSVPLKERKTKLKTAKQQTPNSRQRRSASVEPSQVETKRRTRSTRGTDILNEVIVEEETESQESAEASKKVSTKRTRTSSKTSVQEMEETSSRPRRGRKKQEETSDQFLFSQPDKPDDLPLDEKAIGEVPKYVFSPPHTRSRATAPDYRG